MIVIDANVAAKWYLPEEGSTEALKLLGGSQQLIAPALIRIEVIAAITRRVRRQELTENEAREDCQEWLADLTQNAVELVPEADILDRAMELSLSLRHAMQDCLYLAVADEHGVPFVTADKPLFKKASAQRSDVHFLTAWPVH